MTENALPQLAGPSWHPTESALLDALTDGAQGGPIAAHVSSCLRCRVFAARLETAERQGASGATLTALTASSPELPKGLLEALRADDPEGTVEVATGQLWRATDRASGVKSGIALLVWVRKVLGSTVSVLPVVLDTDMADEYSLLLDAHSSPIGLELAVLTGIDGEVAVANLVALVATLDIDADVRAVRRAADAGRPPESASVRTGPAIVRDDDQRIEYRQVVGELMNALGASRDEPDVVAPGRSGDAGRFNVIALLDTLDDLSYFEPGLRVERAAPGDGIHVDPAHLLRPVAAVHHLSTCVLVIVLTGPDPSTALLSGRLAGLCHTFQHRYIEADSLAVCAAVPDWPALLLSPADTSRAMGAPSGIFADARAPEAPLELATALRKLFDGSRDTWHEAAPVRFGDLDENLRSVRALSVEAARTAVARIRREGTRAIIPSKRHGYAAVDDTAVGLVGSLIAAVLDGTDPDDAVRGLLGEFP